MNTCWIEFLSPVTLVSGPISHAVAKIISDIADRLLDFCRRLWFGPIFKVWTE